MFIFYYCTYTHLTGTDGATSNYPCIWCKCHIYNRWNPENKFSTTDKEHGACSLEEIIN